MDIPFYRVLQFGSVGKDVLAVKRALAIAGFGALRGATPVFGPIMLLNLKKFQHTFPVMPTGKYGKPTHERLVKYFDAYCRQLYLQASAPPPNALLLPQYFQPTHDTSGLPGYPAIDIFRKAGTVVLAPEDGVVDRLSGHDPADGPVGSVHGPFGWSIYITSPTARYFLTHFGTRSVSEGQSVHRKQPIGTVGDYAKWGGWDHIHEGKHTF